MTEAELIEIEQRARKLACVEDLLVITDDMAPMLAGEHRKARALLEECVEDVRALLRCQRKHRLALERIADLPKAYGHFDGADAATEAIRLAKEALCRPKVMTAGGGE